MAYRTEIIEATGGFVVSVHSIFNPGEFEALQFKQGIIAAKKTFDEQEEFAPPVPDQVPGVPQNLDGTYVFVEPKKLHEFLAQVYSGQ